MTGVAGRIVAVSVVCLAVSGCLQGGGPRLDVRLTAPKLEGTSMLIDVLASGGNPISGSGTFAIRFEGDQVYPGAGSGSVFLRDGVGSTEVAYADFLVGNGLYDVEVTVKGANGEGSVEIHRFITSLLVVPEYDRTSQLLTLHVDFFSSRPHSPVTAVNTSGNATIRIQFESEPAPRFETTLDMEQADFGFDAPIHRDSFYAADGNYTARVVFTNAHAKGNVVTNDPDSPDRFDIVERR